MNYDRIPQRTIFIRDNPKEIDPSSTKDKVIAIKSSFEDRGVIRTLPGAVWRGRVSEWWIDPAHIEEVAKVLAHYKMHSTAMACLEEAQEKNLGATRAWNEFDEQVSKELPSYLFEHQKRVIHWADQLDTGCIFMDTGTGKTLTALEIAKRKIAVGKVHRWLVVCPLSLVRTVWVREAKQWHPEMKVKPLWHSSGSRSAIALQRALTPNKDEVHVINFDTFRQIHKQLITAQNSNRPLYDGLIVDESSIMKNAGSKITQALIDFGDTVPTRFILSGCPAPNSPLEYFSQLKLIDPEVLGQSFLSFRDRWFSAAWGASDKWTISDRKFGELMQKIRQVAVFIKKDECLDLPEQMIEVREVPMNDEQDRVYREIEGALASQLDDNLAVISPNTLAKAMKLRQVTSGFVIPTDLLGDKESRDLKKDAEALDAVLKSLGIRPTGDADKIDEFKRESMKPKHLSDNKLNAVMELLTDELADKQVIVWCQFTYEFEQLAAALTKAKVPFDFMNGEQDKKRYPEIDEAFREGKIRVLICHPRSVAHGHTWVNASYNVWMTLSYSYEEFKQGRDRIHRHGQTVKCTDILFASVTKKGEKTIDHVLASVLAAKGDLAEAVTRYLRGEDADDDAA